MFKSITMDNGSEFADADGMKDFIQARRERKKNQDILLPPIL